MAGRPIPGPPSPTRPRCSSSPGTRYAGSRSRSGRPSPIHHDLAAARARGYRDLVAPAFFFTTLGLSLGRFLPPGQLREDGLARDDEVVGRVVAGDTTIEWSGAIVAGDEVRVTQRFLGRRGKAGRSGPFTIFEYTRSYTVDGHQVVLEHLARIAR